MFKLFLAFLLSFVFIEFLFLHFQVFLFGSVVYQNVIFKALLLVSLLTYLFFHQKIFIKKSSLYALYLVYIVYLLFDYTFMLFYFNYSINYLAVSFSSSDYIIMITFLIFVLFKANQYDNKFTIIVFTLGIIVVIGGIEQYLIGTQKFIVTTTNKDINSYNFYGQDRLFSYFSSGLNFGVFLSFLLVSVLTYMKPLLSIKNFLLIPFILLILFLIYNTFTRNVYVMVIMSLFSLSLFSMGLKRIIRYLPYIYGIAIVVLLSKIASNLSASVSGSNIDSAQSTFMRFLNWGHVLTLYMRGDTMSQLFGLGLIQNSNLNPDLVIDNTFLGILLQHGLIGLILFLFLWHQIWIYLLDRYYTSIDRLSLIVAVMFSTFFAINMLNTIYVLYFIILGIYFLFTTDRKVSNVCN
jgi:hypothetical protein